MRKTLLRYGISFAVAAALAALYLVLNGFSLSMELVERYKLLSNAFTVSAVVMLGLGGLVWISTTGLFDGIGYALKHVVIMMIPGYFRKEMSYADYKAEKAEKRKSVPILHLLLVGLVFAALTAIFMVKFYSVYNA